LLNLSRAVFLDRDGTLIEEREYLSRPADVALENAARVEAAVMGDDPGAAAKWILEMT
jgi:histidinol phosphatase-like enzyme